ncbi:hypothetical protein C8R45DRAFT_988170 [Mycena sanguinolenta]|nr:hypothetical protein C8R45DRAFT_988170 [Mycena sanguinolenta]
MPLPRLFRSPTNEWVSPLITVARGLVSVGNCVPFPYVNTALSAGLALLELIESVKQSGDDLKYLAESVVTIMKLLREEMDSHPITEDTKFHEVCEEFTGHLRRLSKDLESMSSNWSSSKFRKYLNSRDVREEIALFTRRVNDLRANTTLIAATGARMEVAAVKSMVSEVQRRLDAHPSTTIGSSDSLRQGLARFEEDYHALKLGDIHLEFGTARTNSFPEIDYGGREIRTGWTDYKATINGCIRTARVYQGSNPTKLWKDFLTFLADSSLSPHLPQLFGFCSSSRLPALIFHGEYRTLDEYAATLSSARDIVDWELSLVFDSSRVFDEYRQTNFRLSKEFAMVNNAQDGKLVFLHAEDPGSRRIYYLPSPPFTFIMWFTDFMPLRFLRPRQGMGMHPVSHLGEVLATWRQSLMGIDSSSQMREALATLTGYAPSIFPKLVYLWAVYSGQRIVAKLATGTVTVESTWAVIRGAILEEDEEFPPEQYFPTAEEELRDGFTHFIVPLVGTTRKWLSRLDEKSCYGYFLQAEMQFGKSVPDAKLSWMAQAQSVLSKYGPSIRSKPSDLRVCKPITYCTITTVTKGSELGDIFGPPVPQKSKISPFW